MPWAVPVPIGAIEPCPVSFSSASTIYERDTSRSPTRRPVIRRKPLPQSALALVNYQNHSAPLVPSAPVSGEYQGKDHSTTVPNGNVDEGNDTMPLEQTGLIPKCTCGHINDMDLRCNSQSSGSKRTAKEKATSGNRLKKLSLFSTRYWNL